LGRINALRVGDGACSCKKTDATLKLRQKITFDVDIWHTVHRDNNYIRQRHKYKFKVAMGVFSCCKQKGK